MTAPRRVDRPVLLRNVTCCYCGAPLEPPVVITKDHVIGRRFVPKGKLDGCWNLLVRACSICNGRKSDLEDDISAISMQPDVFGRFAVEDPDLAVEAARKAASSLSRLTKKAVKESEHSDTFGGRLGPGASFSFTTVGPPQVDDERAWELARLQLSAFFYALTFDRETRRGGFWPGAFRPLPLSPRNDWGNRLNRSFMTAVAEWAPRLIGTTASGFFKIAIRRKLDADLWSWAVEWNHKFRLTGFLGDPGVADEVARTFSWPEAHVVSQNGDHIVRMREEIPLPEDEDILFSEPETAETAEPAG